MAFWQMAYNYGWATKDDLKLAVQLKEITPEQYKEITNEEYQA